MTHDQPTADPVPPQTARKRDATPTGDGDTTAARRQLLALLIDRVETGALLGAETPLLRPLVDAEQASVEQLHLVDSMRQNNLDAACAAVERADRAESVVYRLRQAVGEARAAALPRSELDRFVQQMVAILDTPSDGEPATVVACTCNPRGACDAPCDAKKTPVEPARCSPLVNPDCPGHQAPPYCERAPSNPMAAPPDWEQREAELDRREALLDAQPRHTDAPSEPQP